VINCPVRYCFPVAAKAAFNLGNDLEEEAIVPYEVTEVFFERGDDDLTYPRPIVELVALYPTPVVQD
jgi:hypothetical protein